jgi:hypothetical protein
VPNAQTIEEMEVIKRLAIDGYFEEVCNSNDVLESTNTWQVNDDGSAEEVYGRIEMALGGFAKRAQRRDSL